MSKELKKDHFLNAQQKAVKQKIMEDLLSALYDNLNENANLFDNQSFTDLIGSILVMFNRDVLIRFITNFNLVLQADDMMKDIFGYIKQEVNEKIKRSLP
jgi:hypothetical protein